MTYSVFFTDDNLNPEPLEVVDNTPNTATSLTLPGRNQTGYGRLIAENFLHLLENFASDVAPSTAKAVIGQLWYNSNENRLFVFDGIGWKTTSNIKTAVNEPTDADVGDLWVNTSTQQLYLWSGTNWILVGPQFSEGTRSGPLVESLFDIDNLKRTVIIFYTDDIPVSIISRDQFVPKISIQGFSLIRTGINLTTRTDIGAGAFTPKFVGIATSAEGLVVGTNTIPSTSFLRTDEIGTIQKQFNVKDNAGLTVGTDGNFRLSVSNANSTIYNSTAGAAIDIQTSRSGQPNTIIRVVEDKVGINTQSPTEALDILGNLELTGTILSNSTDDATNLENGSVRTLGGLAVSKNIIVGGDVELLNGTLKTKSLEPRTASETIGKVTNRYNTIYADTIVANTIEGNLDGDIGGNANSATSLRSATNFKLEGDVQSNVVSFNGTGNLNKVFTTQLTADIISNKPSIGTSKDSDEILVYRSSTGLRKTTRAVFFDDLSVPIGTILPYAGQGSGSDAWRNLPPGYLLCDGSEVEVYRYRALFEVIGSIYNGSVPLTPVTTSGGSFRLPDLRGRFVLGLQTMNNDLDMPFPGGIPATTDLTATTYRVKSDGAANILGDSGGASEYIIEPFNIPDHDHDLQGRRSDNQPSNIQYYVLHDRATSVVDFTPQTPIGPPQVPNSSTAYGTLINQSRKMTSSGLVRIADENRRAPGASTSLTGRPFEVLNPFITLNYIIRSGKPIEEQTV
jgi:microcystin-dependent protein